MPAGIVLCRISVLNFASAESVIFACRPPMGKVCAGKYADVGVTLRLHPSRIAAWTGKVAAFDHPAGATTEEFEVSVGVLEYRRHLDDDTIRIRFATSPEPYAKQPVYSRQ